MLARINELQSEALSGQQVACLPLYETLKDRFSNIQYLHMLMRSKMQG